MGITKYIKETKAEMKHVVWPSRQTTTVYTILIVVISLFIAAYLGLFDWIFTNLLEFVS
jgi:preprotein translocase subunit SecE